MTTISHATALQRFCLTCNHRVIVHDGDGCRICLQNTGPQTPEPCDNAPHVLLGPDLGLRTYA